MYVYIKSEPGLWTVGFYDPDGDWCPESDHATTDAAAERVSWLNGNTPRGRIPCDNRATFGAMISQHANPGTRTRTLTRGRLEVVLDLDQVVKDNPGEGTPAIVRTTDGKGDGTYWAAVHEGELICGREVVELTAAEMMWLNSLEDEVNEFLFCEEGQE